LIQLDLSKILRWLQGAMWCLDSIDHKEHRNQRRDKTQKANHALPQLATSHASYRGADARDDE
jgi:hypothetical protein